MSEVAKLKEQIAKSREDLKAAFDSQEDGKYTPEAKEKIKGLNTELAGLVDDLKVEEARVKNEKALEVDKEPCLLYTSPSPRDRQKSRMPSSA